MPTGKRTESSSQGFRLRLPQGQRDSPLLQVELRDDRFDLVADLEDLGRVDDLLRPGHLADVDEAFDTLFDLDESTVVDEADHLAAHARAERKLLVDQGPGIFGALLVAERRRAPSQDRT